MPRASNRFDRAHQMLAYWRDQSRFKTPHPVDLVWVRHISIVDDKEEGYSAADLKRGVHGLTYRENRRLVIQLSRRAVLTWIEMVDTMIHEYAHAMDWRHASLEDLQAHHGDEFWLIHGRLWRDWYEGDGWLDSRQY